MLVRTSNVKITSAGRGKDRIHIGRNTKQISPGVIITLVMLSFVGGDGFLGVWFYYKYIGLQIFLSIYCLIKTKITRIKLFTNSPSTLKQQTNCIFVLSSEVKDRLLKQIDD